MYTVLDLRATFALLDSEALGNLNWVETCRLIEGAQVFADGYCCGVELPRFSGRYTALA